MTQETGAPTDVEGPPALDDRERATFAAVADHLIPAVADMPSAADVVTTTGSGSCSARGPTWPSRSRPRSEQT